MPHNYAESKTLQDIQELLIERWTAGEERYGKHIDEMTVPTEITGETSWAEMALNEALDGVVYNLRALQERKYYERLRTSAAMLLEQYNALKLENKELTDKLQEYKQEEQYYQKTRESLMELKTVVRYFNSKLAALDTLLENNTKVSELMQLNEKLDNAEADE